MSRLQAFVTTFATSIVIGGIALMVPPQARGALPSTPSASSDTALRAALCIAGDPLMGFIFIITFFANIPYQFQSIVQGVIILFALAAGIFVSRTRR